VEIEKSFGSISKRVWAKLAFLGRYCNQPVDVMMRMPVSYLEALIAETGDLLDRESQPRKGRE